MTILNAEYIMENARVFYDAGYEAMQSFYILKGNDTITHRSFLTVAATNIHFAVELAFKALSAFTVQDFEPQRAGHNLVNLFEGLSELRKREISEEYDTKLHLSTTFEGLHGLTNMRKDKQRKHLDNYKIDLPNMLANHKDGFVSWRYNSYGIKEPILFFDYHALAILFQILQLQVGFIIIQEKAKAERIH